MKTNFKNIIAVLAIIVVVIISVLAPKSESSFFTAGDNGLSLKEKNEKAKITLLANANQTTDGQTLAEVGVICSYRKSFNDFYVGAYALGAYSTQFGKTVPYLHFHTGVDKDKYSIEYRMGDFARNSIGLCGVDAQFSNNMVVAGSTASAANAMQLSSTFKTTGTTIAFGQNGASEFYSLDGDLFASISQKVGNFEFAGGADFAENTTGFASAKWSDKKNIVTFIGNKLGSESQSFIGSYYRILSDKFGFSSSLFSSSSENKLHLVGSYKLLSGLTTFAQLGCGSSYGSYLPYGGIGCSYVF